MRHPHTSTHFPYTTLFRSPEAIAALEKAIELEPQFAQAWYNLGLACSAAENPERALEALGRAESLDAQRFEGALGLLDRKSTRLNSSHRCISYAVFCLKKK